MILDGEGCLRADFIGKMSVGNEFHHVFSKCDLSVSELTDGIVTLTVSDEISMMIIILLNIGCITGGKDGFNSGGHGGC